MRNGLPFSVIMPSLYVAPAVSDLPRLADVDVEKDVEDLVGVSDDGWGD